MKKLLSILTLTAVILSMTSFAFASDKEAVKTDVISLSELLSDTENLVYQKSGDDFVELKEKNGVYEREIANGKGGSVSAPVFSADKKFKNEIFSVDMEFNFDDGDGGKTSFNAFQLRAGDNNKVCWTTKCYVVIVKSGGIEIQSFKPNNTFHLNTDAKIPEGEKVNVMYGAVDTDLGVYIFIKIGDTVYGALDNDMPITEEGYMNIEWRTKFKAYETKGASVSIPVTQISYNAKDGSVKSEQVILNGGDAKDCTIKDRKWYFSADGYKPDMATRFAESGVYFEDMFEVIDGESGEGLSVMPGDIGLYTLCELTTDVGLTVKSNEEYISSAEYLLEKGVAGLVDCGTLFANGKYIKYDEENSGVTAIDEDGVIYVPVRGVVEAFNRLVGWDGDLQMVYVDANSEPDLTKDFHTYDSSFKIGDLGWTQFRLLMGANMAAPSIIYEDRAMLAYNDLGNLLNFKSTDYDEKTGLFTYSDIKLNLTDDDKALILDFVENGPLE